LSGTGAAERKPGSEGPDAAAVADYLARHPDFLVRHPELLRALTPVESRHGDGVADFQRFVVTRLQSDLARLASGHAEFAAASRATLAQQRRVHRVVLALVAARSLAQLVEVATVDLALELEVDAVALGVETDPAAPFALRAEGLRVWPRGRIDTWLPGGRAALLVADGSADPALFAAAAPLVRSLALLRLDPGDGRPAGLLALGARDGRRFHPGQGNDLLLFLAGALAACLAAWTRR
jgi:uncharacterized protein YigA (DUF484 family)